MVQPSRARSRPRGRASVASVAGELLLTAGVVVLGYLAWQVTLADAVMGERQQEAGRAFAQQLDAASGADGGAVAEEALRTDAPPAEVRADDRESFAVVHIPRLGEFERVVGEGTSRAVLDSLQQGLAHYETSAMPGEVGNFAVAGHRNGQGGPFTHLDEMRLGDRVYVRTEQAWNVYELRNHEYVPPTAVDVVAPVPRMPEVPADGRYLTLTTCNPEWSAAGRLIAYATWVGWSPAADGMPAELAAAIGEA
ncbi:class E sortase [Agrococcus terreus]|uniref:class E sortase n=1 Tax=Agrococcus terreus TaxID=574649 RepID=UPI0031DC5249